MAMVYLEEVDVVLHQEMLIKQGKTPNVQGYHVFSEPENPQEVRGCMILVKNDIPCKKIEQTFFFFFFFLRGRDGSTRLIMLWCATIYTKGKMECWT